jgi:hypothetical protein
VAIAHVQDVCNSASSTTVAVSLSATGAGNTLIAPCRCFTPNAPPGPYTESVTGGGTWTFATSDSNAAPPALAFTTSGGASSAFINYILSAASVTSVSTTVTTGNYFEPTVGEFSGIGSAAPGGTNSGSSSNPAPKALSYSAGDLVVMIAYAHDGSTYGSPPTGFTAFNNLGDNANWACWQIMSGSGTLSGVTWPSSITDWITAAQVFHPAGGTSHTATASLTVTPSFSATAVRASRNNTATAALTVTPVFSAATVQAHVRTAALTVTPVFRAVAAGGAARRRSTAAPSSDEARGFKRWLLWGA